MKKTITIKNYPINKVRENKIKEMLDKGYSFIGFEKIKDKDYWNTDEHDFIPEKINLYFEK